MFMVALEYNSQGQPFLLGLNYSPKSILEGKVRINICPVGSTLKSFGSFVVGAQRFHISRVTEAHHCVRFGLTDGSTDPVSPPLVIAWADVEIRNNEMTRHPRPANLRGLPRWRTVLPSFRTMLYPSCSYEERSSVCLA